MTSPFVVYHNPKCSKSREALKILRAHRIEPQVVEYLKTPLDVKQLAALLRKLGLRPRDILREGEDEYAQLHLENPSLSDDELLAAIAQHPILMQRPIVVRGERAVIGRPTEKVKELLEL